MSNYTAVLSVAGSDCSGGAGIQADLKTFSALNVYGMSVITSVVAENTSRVISVYDLPEKIIRDQIKAVFEDIEVSAVKVGMIKNRQIMEVVFEALNEYGAENIVCDPVMLAKGGEALMEQSALDYLKSYVIPQCSVFTPNIPEAQVILNRNIVTAEDMEKASADICKMGAGACLVKGGHFGGEPVDVLCSNGKISRFYSKRINTKNTHGTGCTLSSAIACFLAKGYTVGNAVEKAKEYITGAIAHSLEIGKGNGPLNHFYNIKYGD
ncbi:MAG: bifunctional hydroxymethylpyrimidine kinase/phosphomethylpyrimidine kinase [Oscillospiraceae bacterium]|nr:bifunctional hydroxymethylpyrimidine kinase/phosphomethylpyrimidine kinase [Oscillospiraceae bacterium]